MTNRTALHAASYIDQGCLALTSQSGVMRRGRVRSKFVKVCQGDRNLPNLTLLMASDKRHFMLARTWVMLSSDW